MLVNVTDRVNRYSQYQLVKAKFLRNNTLQQMIMDGSALPMTPDMDWILQYMTGHGMRHSMLWYNDVLAVLAWPVHEREQVTKQELVKRSIQLLMEEVMLAFGPVQKIY